MTGHRDLFDVYRHHAADKEALAHLDALAELLDDDERAGEYEVERINLGIIGCPALWEERL
jgi:hypothetical protein